VTEGDICVTNLRVGGEEVDQLALSEVGHIRGRHRGRLLEDQRGEAAPHRERELGLPVPAVLDEAADCDRAHHHTAHQDVGPFHIQLAFNHLCKDTRKTCRWVSAADSTRNVNFIRNHFLRFMFI
jgi:hypothetical protein